MKIRYLLGFLVFSFAKKCDAQNYQVYSNESLVIHSEFLQDSICLNLHLPETYPFSDPSFKYPITIIFDSQHERTYPHIINSFDLLTGETQIPEGIIIGVPLSMQNRYYLTSNQKKEGDTLSGIEKMELFIFSELLPKLQTEFKGSDFICLMGHSRTGFLVNYLTYKRAKEINIAISLSGFYSEPPLSLETFATFLSNPNNFSHKISYYCTAGTTQEELTYLTEYRNLFHLLVKDTSNQHVQIKFNENLNANHLTNYWISASPILIDAFSAYNHILDHWLYNRLKKEKIKKPIVEFKQDFEIASKQMGGKLNPGLTHIFSLASYYAQEKNEYETAIDFLELGIYYYPLYVPLYMEIIEYHQTLKQENKVKHYQQILRNFTVNN